MEKCRGRGGDQQTDKTKIILYFSAGPAKPKTLPTFMHSLGVFLQHLDCLQGEKLRNGGHEEEGKVTTTKHTMQKKLAPPSPELFLQVFDRLYIAQNMRSMAPRSSRIFQAPKDCKYLAYCDDFGPVNIASVLRFNSALNDELDNCDSNHKLIFKVERGRRAMSNAVFMLGAYMILEQKKSVDEVEACFSWADSKVVEGFRDATYTNVDFELSICDCWRGLVRGLQIGWIRHPKAESRGSVPTLDLRIYEHFDNPLNGDLHTVVPGKIIAFAGPVELPDGQHYFDDNGYRRFSAAYYARPFSALGVTDVVQLNFSTYDTSPFSDRGIVVHQLPFADCTYPPQSIVDAFLRIVDNARGLVAVHCRAGLGRTGTLIARYLMRSHGFAARQSIAWLRILRSGCVIGPQQQYLCSVESSLEPPGAASRRPASSDAQKPEQRRLRLAATGSVHSSGTADSALDPASRPAKAWRSQILPALPSRSAEHSDRATRSLDLSLSQDQATSPLFGSHSSLRPRPSGYDAAGSKSPLAAQVRDGMAARGAARIAAQLGAGASGPDADEKRRAGAGGLGGAGWGRSAARMPPLQAVAANAG